MSTAGKPPRVATFLVRLRGSAGSLGSTRGTPEVSYTQPLNWRISCSKIRVWTAYPRSPSPSSHPTFKSSSRLVCDVQSLTIPSRAQPLVLLFAEHFDLAKTSPLSVSRLSAEQRQRDTKSLRRVSARYSRPRVTHLQSHRCLCREAREGKVPSSFGVSPPEKSRSCCCTRPRSRMCASL